MNTHTIDKNIFSNCKHASRYINTLDDQTRRSLVLEIGEKIATHKDQIIAANKRDLDLLSDADPKKDRLILNGKRLDDIVNSAKEIAGMADPTRTILLDKILDNGLHLQKVSVPIGVVGVIYESRPNVTIDIALLGLRSGNAVLLKGGKEAEHSNKFLVNLIQEVLEKNHLDKAVVTLLPVDRAYTQALLEADDFVDILIPRGSENLIKYVRENSKIPTIETGAGVCHAYVESTGDLDKAVSIIVNAKTQRPAVCNALDTIIVDENIASAFLAKLTPAFEEFGIEVFADEKSHDILQKHKYKKLHHATLDDFGKEFLDLACSIKTVPGIKEALEHIRKYSSKHSESIITQEKNMAELFIKEVDAAAVYHNASTRFTDGGVFGLGAEIGISTQKLHARGPFGMEKLVTEKWIGRGNGQIRP